MTKLLRFTLLGVALGMGSAAWGMQPQQASDSGGFGGFGKFRAVAETKAE